MLLIRSAFCAAQESACALGILRGILRVCSCWSQGSPQPYFHQSVHDSYIGRLQVCKCKAAGLSAHPSTGTCCNLLSWRAHSLRRPQVNQHLTLNNACTIRTSWSVSVVAWTSSLKPHYLQPLSASKFCNELHSHVVAMY